MVVPHGSSSFAFHQEPGRTAHPAPVRRRRTAPARLPRARRTALHGAAQEWMTCDVYGQPTIRDKGGAVVSQSAVGNPYLFTGREYDPESGLYFYRARHRRTPASPHG